MKGTATIPIEYFEELLKAQRTINTILANGWWCCGKEDDIDRGFLAFDAESVLEKEYAEEVEKCAAKAREKKWDEYRTKKEAQNEAD